MALPGKADLRAYRGDSWSQTFRFLTGGVPVDLEPPAVVAAWALGPDGREHKELTVTLGDPGEVTIAETFDSGVWTYDVEVTTPDSVTTWVAGRITVTDDITNRPGVAA